MMITFNFLTQKTKFIFIVIFVKKIGLQVVKGSLESKYEQKRYNFFFEQKISTKIVNVQPLQLKFDMQERKKEQDVFEVLRKIQALDAQEFDSLTNTIINLRSEELFYLQNNLSKCLIKIMKKNYPNQKEKIEKFLKCIQLKLNEFSHLCSYPKLLKCFEYFSKIGGVLPSSIQIQQTNEQPLFLKNVFNRNFCLKLSQKEKKISSENINTHMKQIANGRIKLPDFSCIGCISRIYEGWRVADDVSSSNVIYLDGLGNWEGLEIQKHACALLNSGGGYLICGADPQTHQAEGQIVSEKAKAKYRKLLEAAFEEISPKQFSFKFDFVPVLPSPFVQKQPEKGKYLTRISFELQSRRPGEVFYSKMEKKGAQTIFEVYMKEGNQAKQLQGQKIYRAFQSLPSRKRFKKKDHQCEEPEFGNPLENQEGEFFGEEKGEKIERIQPKYRNSSLLSVGSPNKIANIHNFQKLLKQNKVVYEMHQPFMKYQPKNGRQTFFLSYEEKFENLKGIIAKLQPSSQPRLDKINLEITMATGLSKLSQKKFKQQFKKFYNNQSQRPYQFKFSHQKNKNYQKPQFKLKSLSESVFAYICFEYLGIRCSFETK